MSKKSAVKPEGPKERIQRLIKVAKRAGDTVSNPFIPDDAPEAERPKLIEGAGYAGEWAAEELDGLLEDFGKLQRQSDRWKKLATTRTREERARKPRHRPFRRGSAT